MRKATNSDIDAINETMRLSKAYWGYDKAFMDNFVQKFSVNEQYLAQNTVKVLIDGQKVIGIFSFIYQEDRTLELDLFFLHPSHIGKGIGKQLWNDCCAAASELGAKEFIIWSDPNAELFYAKMGCEKIGVKKSPFLPNRYPPIMRYKIPARISQGVK